MNTEVIIALIGVLSSIVTWYCGKKKANAETASIEIESLRSVISQQNDQIKTLNERIQELTKQVFELQNEVMRSKAGKEYKEA